MNRIICDVCGTTYPDTARQCPICGYIQDPVEQELGQQPETTGTKAPRKERGGHFSQSNVRRRNRDADRGQPPERADGYEDYYEEEEPSGSNPFLVALLVVVIVALLAVTAFIFFRYYLPNQPAQDPTPSETVDTTPSESTGESTIATVPCTSLAITDGVLSVTLEAPGDKHLLNVMALPSDTTDVLTYQSADESVATVNADGRVTAVGEGETVITITCGSQSMHCAVICQFPEPTNEPAA